MLSSDHVFAVAGRVAGAEAEQGGFAVAASPNEVVTGLKDLGFEVVALSSLSDIEQNLTVLHAIAARSEAIGAAEFLDLVPPDVAARHPDQVFTFTGHSPAEGGFRLCGGFASAPDREFLKDYLHAHGFEMLNALSLSDCLYLVDSLKRVALNPEHEGAISFLP